MLQQPNYQAARNYWKVLKNRLVKEGNQSVTNCNRLKLEAADGKKYLTDVANAETLLRLIQSVPSPKAEPIKLWLAKVGYERMQENTIASKTGGGIAKKARLELEHKTGKRVVSKENYLGADNQKTKKLGQK